MTVADLFVNIGIKGADEVGRSLGTVNTGIKEIKDNAIGMKVALFAAIYALEKLTLSAAGMGSNYKHFEESTGLSAQTLQQWQKELMNFGASANDVQGSVMNLQNAIYSMIRGKGVPESMALAFQKAGVDPKRIEDTFYLLEKLRNVAKQSDVGLGKSIFSDLGFSPDMYQALRRSTGDISKIHADLGKGEINSLEQVSIAWEKLYRKVSMFFAHIVAKDGKSWIQMLSNAFDIIEKTTKQFQKWSEYTATVQTAIIGIAAVFAPITTAITGIIWLMSEYDKKTKGEKSIFGTGKDYAAPEWFKAVTGFGDEALHSLTMGDLSKIWNDPNQFKPKPTASPYGGSVFAQPSVINQTNHNYGNAPEIAHEINKANKRSLQQTYIQMPKGIQK